MAGLLSENDRASACAPTGEPPAVIETFVGGAVGASALLGSVDIEGSTVHALATHDPGDDRVQRHRSRHHSPTTDDALRQAVHSAQRRTADPSSAKA